MQIDIDRELTKGFPAHLIREKAKQLVRRPEFSKSDRPDIEQELKFHLWERLPKFDPQVAHWNVFVTTVVERHVATIVEHRGAEKRAEKSDAVSLSVLVDDGDGNLVPLANQIGPHHREPLTGHYAASAEELTDLRLDLEEALATLPPDLRELCEQLKHETLTEMSRRTGTPRSTLASKVDNVRTHLEGRGLQDFLGR